jgi:hypothetical protein
MNKFAISRNLGFITGPLLLLLGIFSYMKGTLRPLSMIMIILGIIRIGLTIYSYVLSRKENNQQQIEKE